MTSESSPHGEPLARGLGFWQASAINIAQIVGAGVFITIPTILGVLPGAYAILAWLVAGLLILCDGMIWAELGAALPSAGGSYHYLLESYGRSRWGRLMAFLFVWQILISGPLEVGSGLVAAAQFSTALDPAYKLWDERNSVRWEVVIEDAPKEEDQKKIGVTFSPSRVFGLALGVLILALLYRRVTTLGRLSVIFVLGVLALLGWILVEGAIRFDPALALDTVERPKDFGPALGAGMGYAIYAYLGYYNVCYLGGEVRNPTRTIPRAILFSALAVVVLFALTQLAITAVVPWREAAAEKNNVPALFMSRIHGPWAATLVTLLLVGSCFASCFSGTLGYSRVPFAAARDGNFFRWFGAVHPRLKIPHRSLLLLGGMILFWSFFSLDAIITALIATRILEQFVTQVFAVMLLRRSGRPMPWRMWLYPLPCLVALVGWLFVYANTGMLYIVLGAGTLLVGVAVFVIRAYRDRSWPFATPASPIENGRPD